MPHHNDILSVMQTRSHTRTAPCTARTASLDPTNNYWTMTRHRVTMIGISIATTTFCKPVHTWFLVNVTRLLTMPPATHHPPYTVHTCVRMVSYTTDPQTDNMLQHNPPSSTNIRAHAPHPIPGSYTHACCVRTHHLPRNNFR